MNAIAQYDYFPKVLQVLTAISQGYTRTVACDTYNIPVHVFEKHVDSTPELQDMVIEAERRGYDALADLLVNIDNDKRFGRSDPKMAAVISKNIQWLLSRRDQKRFGDKLEVKHEITLDRVITAALEAGRNRVANIEGRTIELTALPSSASAPVEADEDAELLRQLLS
jgi:hypothetical protein